MEWPMSRVPPKFFGCNPWPQFSKCSTTAESEHFKYILRAFGAAKEHNNIISIAIRLKKTFMTQYVLYLATCLEPLHLFDVHLMLTLWLLSRSACGLFHLVCSFECWFDLIAADHHKASVWFLCNSGAISSAFIHAYTTVDTTPCPYFHLLHYWFPAAGALQQTQNCVSI